jgi:oxygen-dependent protoporphyrinogen oxidase
MAPGALWPFLTTPIFSWRGKLRMACDLLLPRRRSTEDESLAHFVTRRLGHEALERIAQPMVGGIYTADPQLLSMQATIPQFVAMERQHGSLIRALLHNQRVARQQGQTADGTSGPRYGLFVSFRQGMQTLVAQLTECLPAGTVRVHSRVCSLRQVPETQRWMVHLHDQPTLEADALCLALSAPQAGLLLADCDATLAAALQEISYASSAVVNLAFRRADIAHPLNGMGFVVPAVEQRHLIACSFSSVKFAGRAPEGQVLLRAFVGGALHEAHYAQTDPEILHTVGQDLRQLLGITGDPLYIGISRHPQSMAQYHLGHVERVMRIESLVSRLPGLILAGNAYHGVGIPDCIHSGDNAAQALLCQLAPSMGGQS